MAHAPLGHQRFASLLLGPDHVETGEVAISRVTANLAIGLSRGRFPKGYSYVDVNEDAVFGADLEGMTVLAVADGHRGFDAAGAAISAIADGAPATIGLEPDAAVAQLVGVAIEAVAATVPGLASPRDASRTALTVVVTRGARMATATFGDSACFLARPRRVDRIGSQADFLGPASSPALTSPLSIQLRPKTTIVISSDGFIDFVSDATKVVQSVRRLEPHEAVGEILAAAFAGGAGDNIAVGVATPRAADQLDPRLPVG